LARKEANILAIRERIEGLEERQQGVIVHGAHSIARETGRNYYTMLLHSMTESILGFMILKKRISLLTRE
ncbi:hypothetical protein Golax_008195, partial [Gossypium laxum]|nr:hypothetical protein [Gossypium laxum]